MQSIGRSRQWDGRQRDDQGGFGIAEWARMQRLRQYLRDSFRTYQRLRGRLAGWLVRGITETAVPPALRRTAYRLLFGVYFVKRLCQDFLTGRPIAKVASLQERWREVETNFLIKLVVWRDWPIGREYNPYPTYAANNRLTEAEAERMRALSERFEDRPLVSVLVPVYNARPEWIDRLVESVLSQVYDRWELVLVDDGSTDPLTWSAIEKGTARDERIVATQLEKNCGVVEATNRAAQMASGSWLAFLDHDDELFPDALWQMVHGVNANPDVDVVYTDEELRNERTGESHAHYKPGFSPQLLVAYNYICHLLFVRRAAFDDVGGLRPGTEGAQDYDLLLRLIERTDRFVHVPRVLYRWNVVPQSFSRSVDSRTGRLKQVDSIDPVTQRIVQEHLDRLKIPARAEVVQHWVRPLFLDEDRGKATILICTKDQPRRLARCVASIERRTTYPNYELLIVDNGSQKRRTRRLLDRLARRHRVVRIENDRDGFHFSRLNNAAAAMADGEYLVFLNDDTKVLQGGWLSALVGTMQFPKVGAVGARLLYPDGRNQHAGLIVGAMGWGPWHALMGLPAQTNGYGGYLTFPHNCSAVTGACLATRRSLFRELGGFDEVDLAVSFNDVDYCLRVVKAGYRVAYAPQAELIHEEGASRGRCARPTEALALKRRWNGYHDPWWNENLNRTTPHFALDPRRRSRGVGIVNSPRVLFAASGDGSWTEQVLMALRDQGRCVVEMMGIDDWRWTFLGERLGGGATNVVVAEGAQAWPVVDLCRKLGVPTIWSLSNRLMLSRSANWKERAKVVNVIERLDGPYQVVYADPFSVGWAAAGLPRDNQWLAARMPLVDAIDEEEKAYRREQLRAWLEVDQDRVLLAAVVQSGDLATMRFLLGVYRGLGPLRRRCFLLLAIDGTSTTDEQRQVLEAVRATGRGVSVIPVGPDVFAAADVFLAHETVEPRPAAVLEALRHSLPLVATDLVERGDLMHLPATGIVARAFHPQRWRNAIRSLIADEPGRRAMGRQSRAWLESRQSPEDLLGDWHRLLVEAAELGTRVTGVTAASRPERVPPISGPKELSFSSERIRIGPARR